MSSGRWDTNRFRRRRTETTRGYWRRGCTRHSDGPTADDARRAAAGRTGGRRHREEVWTAATIPCRPSSTSIRTCSGRARGPDLDRAPGSGDLTTNGSPPASPIAETVDRIVARCSTCCVTADPHGRGRRRPGVARRRRGTARATTAPTSGRRCPSPSDHHRPGVPQDSLRRHALTDPVGDLGRHGDSGHGDFRPPRATGKMNLCPSACRDGSRSAERSAVARRRPTGRPITVVIVKGRPASGRAGSSNGWTNRLDDRAFWSSRAACIGLSGGTSFPYGPLVERPAPWSERAGRARRLTGSRRWPAVDGAGSDFVGSPAAGERDGVPLQPRVFGAILKLVGHLAETSGPRAAHDLRGPALGRSLHSGSGQVRDEGEDRSAACWSAASGRSAAPPEASAAEPPRGSEILPARRTMHLGPVQPARSWTSSSPPGRRRRCRTARGADATLLRTVGGQRVLRRTAPPADTAGGFQSVDVVVPPSLRG